PPVPGQRVAQPDQLRPAAHHELAKLLAILAVHAISRRIDAGSPAGTCRSRPTSPLHHIRAPAERGILHQPGKSRRHLRAGPSVVEAARRSGGGQPPWPRTAAADHPNCAPAGVPELDPKGAPNTSAATRANMVRL